MRFTFSATLLSLFFIILLATTSSLAQENGLASLEGTVVDAETKQPVVGAIILVETIDGGQPQQQQTIGPTGAFRFTLNPNKNYYIRTEAFGYRYTQEKLIFTSAYATRLYGKIILLKKGGPMMPPAPPKPASVTSPATIAQTKPAATTLSPAVTTQPAPERIVAPPALAARTAPPLTLTAASPVTASSTPTTAPSQSTLLSANKPVPKPAPPVTAQAVRMQLRAAQFVQSKAELVPESQPALDQLLTFLRENPTINIELAGHTDNQGNFDENLLLSRQRVELVKAFLVQHGIAASRISSRGYGSTRPIASNNSEETRRLNRRVELIILTK